MTGSPDADITASGLGPEPAEALAEATAGAGSPLAAGAFVPGAKRSRQDCDGAHRRRKERGPLYGALDLGTNNAGC